MERGREGGGAVGRHGGGLLELEFNGSDLFKPVLPDGLQPVKLHHGLRQFEGLRGHAGMENALADGALARELLGDAHGVAVELV